MGWLADARGCREVASASSLELWLMIALSLCSSVFSVWEKPTIGASKWHSFQNSLSCIGPGCRFLPLSKNTAVQWCCCDPGRTSTTGLFDMVICWMCPCSHHHRYRQSLVLQLSHWFAIMSCPPLPISDLFILWISVRIVYPLSICKDTFNLRCHA